MSEFKKADLSRFQKIEQQLKSKTFEQRPNALANAMDLKASSNAKLDFAQDMALSGSAVLKLMEGDTSGLLEFLCNSKSDRLPFRLRETLVSMLDGESIFQLSPAVAVTQKGLTVEKVKQTIKRRNAIVNAYITAGGLDRHKDGIEAAMKATKLGRSSVSDVMNLDRRNMYKDYRLQMLEDGKSLHEFMAMFKDSD